MNATIHFTHPEFYAGALLHPHIRDGGSDGRGGSARGRDGYSRSGGTGGTRPRDLCRRTVSNPGLLLQALALEDSIPWEKVEGFQMDEYLGIVADHPASFRGWMREHVVEALRPGKFHYLEGDAADPSEEARRYAAALSVSPIHLTCMGIGENGHLAFNDPPVADFADPLIVKRVALDAACKQQQVGEGHFPTLDAVNLMTHALTTVTIPALVGAQRIVCVVLRATKAEAVRRTIHGPVSTECPSSILRRQAHATLYLDADSAANL